MNTAKFKKKWGLAQLWSSVTGKPLPLSHEWEKSRTRKLDALTNKTIFMKIGPRIAQQVVTDRISFKIRVFIKSLQLWGAENNEWHQSWCYPIAGMTVDSKCCRTEPAHPCSSSVDIMTVISQRPATLTISPWNNLGTSTSRFFQGVPKNFRRGGLEHRIYSMLRL